MPAFPDLDAVLVLWGLAVLAFATVQHVYFGGACIQLDGRSHPDECGRE